MEWAWRRGTACILAYAALLATPALGEAAFPGANGPIAFERTVGPGTREIFRMTPHGGQRSLTEGFQFSESPAYSPDGTMIAFARDNDIWVMYSDGSEPRAVVDDLGNGQPRDADPSFSPDGERIVFSRDTNLNLTTQDEIFTVDLVSGKFVNLTQNGSDLDDQPTYSPDGSKIAWIRNEHGAAGPDEIFVMDSDGGNPQNLTAFGAENSTAHPDYAPDGSLIVFAHDGDIWTMDADDGSDKQDITSTPMIGESQPVYSPDGSQIAFARDTGGAPTVDEIFSLGAGLTNLTNSAQDDFGPAWGPLDTVAPQTTITSGPEGLTNEPSPSFNFSSSEGGPIFECVLDDGGDVGHLPDWGCSPPWTYYNLRDGPHTFRVRATDIADNTDPSPATRSFTVDTKLQGSAAAKRTQKQKGKKIVVKAKVKAKEDLDAKATGKVKANPAYKLKPKTVAVAAGAKKTLKLKPKTSKDAKKIAKALKKGKKAKAKLTVKLTDEAGNKRTTKLSVKLKR